MQPLFQQRREGTGRGKPISFGAARIPPSRIFRLGFEAPFSAAGFLTTLLRNQLPRCTNRPLIKFGFPSDCINIINDICRKYNTFKKEILLSKNKPAAFLFSL